MTMEASVDVHLNRAEECRVSALGGVRILELALHAADLSQGIGMPWLIDDELAEFIAAELGDLIIDLGPTGGYAPPQADDGVAASPAERVLRISGR